MNKLELICMDCGKKFIERYKGQRHTKNHHCSEECASGFKSKSSSFHMAKTNRKYASERMKKNNPMKNEKSREKMKTTLRAMGHKPIKRGGNGKGPTIHQLALATALGWEMEVVIPTKIKKGNGYPTCYKVDIGNKILKIAVEVDGKSHNLLSRMDQDKKKDDLLISFGWKVIRFKNEEIQDNLFECVQKVIDIASNS